MIRNLETGRLNPTAPPPAAKKKKKPATNQKCHISFPAISLLFSISALA